MAARGHPASAVAGAGATALAVAMGIGRFAFTPILPMMQQEAAISVGEGGWLASANYLGYLLGALSAVKLPWRAATAIRAGLLVIGIATFSMGSVEGMAPRLLLPFQASIRRARRNICPPVKTAAGPRLNGLLLQMSRLAPRRGLPRVVGQVLTGVGATSMERSGSESLSEYCQ